MSYDEARKAVIRAAYTLPPGIRRKPALSQGEQNKRLKLIIKELERQLKTAVRMSERGKRIPYDMWKKLHQTARGVDAYLQFPAEKRFWMRIQANLREAEITQTAFRTKLLKGALRNILRLR